MGLSFLGTRSFSPLRILLVIVAVVGCGFSIVSNQQLSAAREEHVELRKQVGYLKIDDPGKVVVAQIPASDEVVPPFVHQAHVWRYRIHLPANYGPCFKMQRGLVSADSPRGQGGSGSSWSMGNSEPEEVLSTMALFQHGDKWMFCRSSDGSSSTSSLRKDFVIGSLDDFVIETPVSIGDEARMIDKAEAICLLRFREKELAKKRNGEPKKNLYRGFAVYLFSAKHRDAFEAWANGKVDSMKEFQP
ncbi:hypothetical protein [Rhodopirellula sallentina]|uniref:Uncharacterized protein n=1 Tax=Rhodopirellula sallentina SM41 TaxID=1263870 RepID=M5UMY0_9BACT|nr:hypothetical protein [Rhodopirellula sallentina]EMI57368.1 hypothetical protein RSSM_01209 [Rhodopirellula sallentina SM41]